MSAPQPCSQWATLAHALEVPIRMPQHPLATDGALSDQEIRDGNEQVPFSQVIAEPRSIIPSLRCDGHICDALQRFHENVIGCRISSPDQKLGLDDPAGSDPILH